jgi:hypothetical protein
MMMLEKNEQASTTLESGSEDRRFQARQPFKLGMSCKLVGSGQSTWQGECCDLSQGGIRLMLNRRFEPQTLLLIDLPVDNPSLVSSLLVRVVWTKKQGSRGWLVGCALACPLSDEEFALLIDESSGAVRVGEVPPGATPADQASQPAEQRPLSDRVQRLRQRLKIGPNGGSGVVQLQKE